MEFGKENGIIGLLFIREDTTMLKSTGITREVDNLGRVVLPVELRSIMGIKKGDPLEIFVDVESQKIILNKYHFGCMFCGNGEELVNIKEKHVCKDCLKEIKETTD